MQNKTTNEKLSDAQSFGKIVRQIRESKGISQIELAELSSITPSHLGAIERGLKKPRLDTAELISQALGIQQLHDLWDTVIPDKNPILDDVPQEWQYTTHLPLFSHQAACGYFENGSDSSDIIGWVEVKGVRRRLNKDMLVVRARGASMEPLIHDGDLCVFIRYTPDSGGSRNGKVMLINLHDDSDPDDGANCVIKTYHSTWEVDEEGNRHLKEVVLIPLNPHYKIIRYTEADLQGKLICPVAFFLTTL